MNSLELFLIESGWAEDIVMNEEDVEIWNVKNLQKILEKQIKYEKTEGRKDDENTAEWIEKFESYEKKGMTIDYSKIYHVMKESGCF